MDGLCVPEELQHGFVLLGLLTGIDLACPRQDQVDVPYDTQILIHHACKRKIHACHRFVLHAYIVPDPGIVGRNIIAYRGRGYAYINNAHHLYKIFIDRSFFNFYAYTAVTDSKYVTQSKLYIFISQRSCFACFVNGC